eukprot:18393-Heterococcus_DN1.PRE.2
MPAHCSTLSPQRDIVITDRAHCSLRTYKTEHNYIVHKLTSCVSILASVMSPVSTFTFDLPSTACSSQRAQ